MPKPPSPEKITPTAELFGHLARDANLGANVLSKFVTEAAKLEKAKDRG